ncbi:MAG: hypothetical protein AAGE84_14690 [Cyanobacteria bacterium P01_G01_bin.39]
MTKEISKLGKELRYVTQNIPQKIIQDLDKIKVADAKYTKTRNKYQALLIISSISIFASFFLMSIPILGATVLTVAVIATCFFYYYSQKYARLQIEPARYLLVKKLVYLLQRDLSAKSYLNINLDFTTSIIQSKLTSEDAHPLKPGWKLKIYQDPWLNIQGEFCDRTNFDLNITEHHRISSGWKRSRSGKRKHKRKHKFKGSEICLQLRYPAKKYGAIQVLQQDAMAAIKLPNYVEVKNFKLNNKFILLKVNLPPQFDYLKYHVGGLSDTQKIDTSYETITSIFLSLYQILNLARTLSKVSK